MHSVLRHVLDKIQVMLADVSFQDVFNERTCTGRSKVWLADLISL